MARSPRRSAPARQSGRRADRCGRWWTSPVVCNSLRCFFRIDCGPKPTRRDESSASGCAADVPIARCSDSTTLTGIARTPADEQTQEAARLRSDRACPASRRRRREIGHMSTLVRIDRIRVPLGVFADFLGRVTGRVGYTPAQKRLDARIISCRSLTHISTRQPERSRRSVAKVPRWSRVRLQRKACPLM